MNKTAAKYEAEYLQFQRVDRKLRDRAKRRAAQAHPATGGERHLVHNWGNPDARAAWADFDRYFTRIMRAREARCQRYLEATR